QVAGAQLRSQIGLRPVLLCASTREGEEVLILEALCGQGSVMIDNLLLVIVPRHPQRFDEVAMLVQSQGLKIQRRSTLRQVDLPADVAVLLGDSMGEMFAYLAACDLAFIGGSLLPLGGQNLIEACSLGKPVIIGLHTFNFGTITTDAIAAGAAVRVVDADAMFSQANTLLRNDDLRQAMGEQGLKFAEQQRGATARTMALLESMLVK
ncbi:MAG: 3-deoxy-D-manno-octulosonic acid transferase, partial [Janthinobacterium lividum]